MKTKIEVFGKINQSKETWNEEIFLKILVSRGNQATTQTHFGWWCKYIIPKTQIIVFRNFALQSRFSLQDFWEPSTKKNFLKFKIIDCSFGGKPCIVRQKWIFTPNFS